MSKKLLPFNSFSSAIIAANPNLRFRSLSSLIGTDKTAIKLTLPHINTVFALEIKLVIDQPVNRYANRRSTNYRVPLETSFCGSKIGIKDQNNLGPHPV